MNFRFLYQHEDEKSTMRTLVLTELHTLSLYGLFGVFGSLTLNRRERRLMTFAKRKKNELSSKLTLSTLLTLTISV